MKGLIPILLMALLGGSMWAQDTIPQPGESVASQPQENSQTTKPEKSSAWKSKIYYGGYINFSLGQYTVIGVEPMVGYKVIPRLSAGVKIRYDYISDKRFTDPYHASNYGGSLFARLSLIKRLYVHAEYAGYNYEHFIESGESYRQWVPFLFVGAGYNQPVGKHASLNAQVLFDVLHNENSPYKNWEPFYSVGMSVGF